MNIPLVAVGSLDALAEVAREDYEAGILLVEGWSDAYLVPMIDARRMEVYTRVFNAAGEPLSDVKAEVVDENSFAEWREKRKMIIFGNGAAKCCEALQGVEYVNITPSARGLARLAEERLQRGEVEDIAYFEPFYLKDFVVIPSKKKLL